MSKVNQDEMQKMMREMMGQIFANMTSEEKIEMMMGMMDKMKEGINMEEIMPKMMMAMMSAKEAGGMKEMMTKMLQGGEEKESMMPEMMFKGMMPHCIKIMMPAIAKDKRADLVTNLVSALMEQATSGMSEEEKAAFSAKIVGAMEA